jgi:adenosylcobinamide kinase/adenosylcobinamide-phosphate guanylyltransferase
MPFVLLLGGARSGKSALAVEIAKGGDLPVTFIATAEGRDPEMAARIARHRADRPATWVTIEEPVGLLDAVLQVPAEHLILIDCLTLWVSNLIGRGEDPQRILVAARELANALGARSSGGVVISNEVGLGIVPDNELARGYRDTLGFVNTAFAALATRAGFMVAGRVHELKTAADFMEGLQWPVPRLRSS